MVGYPQPNQGGKMTREELIQELQVLCPYTLKGITGDVACEKVAEYILSRERLLLEKIIEPMKKINPNWDGYVWIHDDYYTPIPKNLTRFNLREHLAIIEKEKGNV
jgi:hypothetical protein